MGRHRSLSGATAIALAVALLCAVGLESRALALPGDPTPSALPSPSPVVERVDLSGHWETDDFGGMDLVQHGTAVSGTSPAGVSFEGTLSGRRVNFRFWHGASYAKADEENRGRGSMTLGADGRTLTVTWETEEKPSPYNGSFTAIRVGPQVPLGPTGSGPTAVPSPRASMRPTLDQLWDAPGGLGPWLAIFFGFDTSQITGRRQPGGLYDQMSARTKLAGALAMFAMAMEYGPDWVTDWKAHEQEAWEILVSINDSLDVPFEAPQPTQQQWWLPPDFYGDVEAPPRTDPLQNPVASGNPLQNP
jgi:hypothetical protein